MTDAADDALAKLDFVNMACVTMFDDGVPNTHALDGLHIILGEISKTLREYMGAM